MLHPDIERQYEEHKPNFAFFAYVVDGEVAMVQALPESNQPLYAILDSNPTIVKSETPIVKGMLWDGNEFKQS